jgi:hypothetical protein
MARMPAIIYISSPDSVCNLYGRGEAKAFVYKKSLREAAKEI